MRVKITLACTECKQRNYNMTKEKKLHPDRMETKKYCRFCKKHTMHKETKQYLFDLEEKDMSDKKETSPALKRSWFQELKLEFKKITWPGKKQLAREPTVVLIVAIIIGAVISAVDALLSYGLNFLWQG